MAEPDGTGPPAPAGAAKRRALRLAVLGLAVLVALIAWLATRDDDGSSEPAVSDPAAPRIVSSAELSEAAEDLGQPIYWVGTVPGTVLELKELGGEGGVQVLYQPEGTEAGEGSPAALTIGSYPLTDPAAALEGFAERPGAIARTSSEGTEVVTSKQSPTSVYLTGEEGEVQVEVYDPSPKRAMSFALSGRVQPS